MVDGALKRKKSNTIVQRENDHALQFSQPRGCCGWIRTLYNINED